LTVDDELARRKQMPDDKPLVSAADLPLAGLASSIAPPTDEDRMLAAEYLDLLQANARLSEPVRHAVGTLRRQLGPDY
jgi:hypothetical protein